MIPNAQPKASHAITVGEKTTSQPCRTKKRSVNLVDDDTSNDPDYAFCLESGSENDSNMLQVEM